MHAEIKWRAANIWKVNFENCYTPTASFNETILVRPDN